MPLQTLAAKNILNYRTPKPKYFGLVLVIDDNFKQF